MMYALFFLLMCAGLFLTVVVVEPLRMTARTLLVVGKVIERAALLVGPLSEHACYTLYEISGKATRAVYNSHRLARSIGAVCRACAEKAPGWWDFDADCAQHQCGRCYMCTAHANAESPRLAARHGA